MTSSVLNASFCYMQYLHVYSRKVKFVANDAIILVIPYIAFIREMEFARKIQFQSCTRLYII